METKMVEGQLESTIRMQSTNTNVTILASMSNNSLVGVKLWDGFSSDVHVQARPLSGGAQRHTPQNPLKMPV
jgi:ABC-type phosphate transport system ATPase subunit